MNQRRFRNIHLVDESKLTKHVVKPKFDCSKKLDNNLHAVHLKKIVVKFDKPTYLGIPILDISKSLMFDFHYNYMCKFKDKNYSSPTLIHSLTK